MQSRIATTKKEEPEDKTKAVSKRVHQTTTRKPRRRRDWTTGHEVRKLRSHVVGDAVMCCPGIPFRTRPLISPASKNVSTDCSQLNFSVEIVLIEGCCFSMVAPLHPMTSQCRVQDFRLLTSIQDNSEEPF